MLGIHEFLDTLLVKCDAILLHWVQDTLSVHTPLKITLRLLTQLEVLHGNLSDELEVLLELLVRPLMVIIELHPADSRVGRRQRPEGGHATAIDIQGADGEEVQEKTIIRFLRVGNVLGEIAVVTHGVERWWVELRKGWMSVLAVKAFLVAIDPVKEVR